MQIFLNVAPNNSEKLILTRSSSRSCWFLYCFCHLKDYVSNRREYITAEECY